MFDKLYLLINYLIDKTITVYCNAESSPVVLRITGDAE